MVPNGITTSTPSATSSTTATPIPIEASSNKTDNNNIMMDPLDMSMPSPLTPLPASTSSENLRRKQLVNRVSNPIITTESDDDGEEDRDAEIAFINDGSARSGRSNRSGQSAGSSGGGFMPGVNPTAMGVHLRSAPGNNGVGVNGNGSGSPGIVVASDENEEDSLHDILKADAASAKRNAQYSHDDVQDVTVVSNDGTATTSSVASTIVTTSIQFAPNKIETSLSHDGVLKRTGTAGSGNDANNNSQYTISTTATTSGSKPTSKSSSTTFYVPLSPKSIKRANSDNSPSASYMPIALSKLANRNPLSNSNSGHKKKTKSYSTPSSPGSNNNNIINGGTNNNSSSPFDFDSTIHRRRGNGILASQGDLSTSPAEFAKGCTLLQLCAIGNLPQVQSYLTKEFNNVNFRDYDRRTALHVACSEGHLEVVKYLVLNKGAKINRSDRWGGSPLDDAHRHRHSEVARFLRKHGGRTGSTNVTTNLIAAAAAGDIEEVTLLLLGNEGGASGGAGGALDISCASGVSGTGGGIRKRGMSLDVSEPSALVAANSVDISKGDYDKRTALHLAAGEGHVDVVEFLCKHGADVNAQDRWGGKPLDDALQKGNQRVADILRRYGATSADDEEKLASMHGGKSTRSMSMPPNLSEVETEDENLQVDFNELEMIERIGSGAFGEIYKCRWRGILVAAKIIKASKIQKEWVLKNRAGMDKSSDRLATRLEQIKQSSITEEEKQLALEDFRKETAIMRRLRHPNIVMMLAYSQTEDVEIMISEIMRCSLLDLFKANAISNAQIPKRTQIVYAQQLAQGMNHLHKSRPPIIHRDLKPANLLIDFSGTLKIADFGLAKIRPNPEQCEVEAFMMTGETGSYRFMAPEVFRHEEYTETVDVYSYAMIFYYMLRSIPPWSGLSGVDAATKAAVDGERPIIPRDVDERLSTLLKRCWDENPQARPSFEEIISCLNIYSHDVFKTDDKEVTLAVQDKGCGCVIS